MSEFDDDNQDYQEDIEQVDDELLDDEQDIEDSQDDEQDADGEEAESQDDSDDDALDFSFDDDGESSDPFKGQEAPEWVKKVREENRELKRQLKQREAQQMPQQVLREEPTLDDHDYDDEAFKQDYAQWLQEKQQIDAQVQAERQKYQQYRERYKADVDAIKAKAPDYDEVELSVVDVLSEQKQGLLQMLVDNPAKVVYALGKNSPAQLDRLSKLDDIQFAKQIVLMEMQMSSKTKSRNQNKPKPKTHELEGAAGGADTRLAKLEAEADRTGDRSKVAAYKKQMRKG
ncbi:hypothetical protein A1019T_01805 [Psychrobacter pasteurii]|uniref:Scaffolding protein n=1 Tax=Psychrobacter pasteurii TaxID=1945520 RepID=A0A1R4EH99_9GAMM|nr:hypothetical protein [Psychrobacter pasteurii]SJM37820.1 hypothetical protein A1019T_01805 [Psychrobacter pasteurii]